MAWRCPGVAHGNRLIVSQPTRGLASELPLTATSDGSSLQLCRGHELPAAFQLISPCVPQLHQVSLTLHSDTYSAMHRVWYIS